LVGHGVWLRQKCQATAALWAGAFLASSNAASSSLFGIWDWFLTPHPSPFLLSSFPHPFPKRKNMQIHP
jgi:hypothetical protein